MENRIPLKKALISVWYKDGLEDLCRALQERGVELYATRGTAAFLEGNLGGTVHKVEDLTQFPEMMEGRVKTLHPRIFGGVLARRENSKDMEEAEQFEVPLFDLVVGNLYPFGEHLGEDTNTQSGFVDIGGPSLVRASAKNHKSVTILSDPGDYPEFLEEWTANDGATTLEFRYRMAGRAFARTSAYDAMIAAEWQGEGTLPAALSLEPKKTLRYGENPHQKAAWCGTPAWEILQGKELSYNNMLDAEAALRIPYEFDDTAVAVIKHNNPCGVASGKGPLKHIFDQAFNADSRSAFGGIVALNRPVDAETAEAMSGIFLEVILAPGYEDEAREILAKKKNLRLIRWAQPVFNQLEVRSALGGWLLQGADQEGAPGQMKSVTEHALAPTREDDCRFAWMVCKHTRSNAIVLANEGVTLGIGAGQMSRVDAVQIALEKSPKEKLQGAVLASDAFFPFRDNIDLLKGSGIAAIIQPGGSKRDEEVIAACNEHGFPMVFTGRRHFRH